MQRFLFIPIFFLLFNIAAAEDLEVYEVTMVAKIITDVGEFLDTQIDAGIDDDPDHHQGIVDHITDNILIAKYKIDPDDIGVFLMADPQTMKVTRMHIALNLIFEDYLHTFPLTPKEGDTYDGKNDKIQIRKPDGDRWFASR
jgi:hypothetical protein